MVLVSLPLEAKNGPVSFSGPRIEKQSPLFRDPEVIPPERLVAVILSDREEDLSRALVGF
jgi:hypothetical protein